MAAVSVATANEDNKGWDVGSKEEEEESEEEQGMYFRMTFAAAGEEMVRSAVERFGDALREVFFVVRAQFFFYLGAGGEGEGRREKGEVGVG